MDANQFPGNSKMPKPEAEISKKIESVVANEVISRKKSFGKRLKEIFIGGDSRSVFNYVIAEVLVPQAKVMLTDMASEGMERLIYGEGRSSSRRPYRSGSNPPPTNYTRYSGRGNNPIGRSGQEERRPTSVRTKGIDEIHFKTRIEADTVLDRMYDLIEKYEAVSVSDLYSLVGWTPEYTDNKWGWMELPNTNVHRVRDGYVLNLPKPQPLD